MVIGCLVGGALLLVAFIAIERRVAEPLLHLELFSNRAFAGGGLANLLANMGRGGLQFMLIIWLQGVWLPLHGYSYAETPFWSSIYLIPLSIGFLASGPVAGHLSDRYGARAFTTAGMSLTAATFVAFVVLPVNFPYPLFAVILLLNGIGTGAFSAPNTSAMMGAVPASQRGAASGIRATSMNTGFVVSIGLFFSLMIIGLSTSLPNSIRQGLLAHGVAPATAAHVAALPPVGTLFAAFLGYNPLRTLLGPDLATLSPDQQAVLTGHSFFPHLIASAFHSGLAVSLSVSALLCAVAAVASWWSGSEPRMS